MKFTITCEAFARLAGITAFFEPTTDDEVKKLLTCLRLENRNGHVFAIATNQKVAAVEYIGATTEPDGAVHVIADPKLVQQCQSEAVYNSFVEVIWVPEILMASVKTMLGFVFQGNAAASGIPEQSILASWRKWLPPEPVKQSKGAMYWTVDHVAALMKASPSGRIAFPEFIDVDVPTVIRDVDAENWFGIFVGKPSPSQKPITPAQVPSWAK